MTTTSLDIGKRLVERFNAGAYDEIYETLYAPQIVSIEADGSECRGIEAIFTKNEWLDANYETHGMKAEGPYPNGDEFAVIFDLDMTDKSTGQRAQTREIGLYYVEEGRIVRETFYYA